jgi:hypothetical protein
MVRGLAEQIGGTLYVTGDNGTFYKLRFKPDQRV